MRSLVVQNDSPSLALFYTRKVRQTSPIGREVFVTNGHTAAAALETFNRQIKHMLREMRCFMTYDRGSEMACHPKLERHLKIDIWFCDPYAPWQRRSNENTNVLLRQFTPNGTDLRDASQTWFNDVAQLMNCRPRKTSARKHPQRPW